MLYKRNKHLDIWEYLLRLYNMNWYSLSDLAILREIGRSLRQLRLNRNQSQQKVADAAGIDRATLSQIEHGRPTSLLTFVQLLRTLDVWSRRIMGKL